MHRAQMCVISQLFEMFIWKIIVIWVVYDAYYCESAETLCSQFITFNEYVDHRSGSFQVNFPHPLQNNFVQMTVFVSGDCKENLCNIALTTDEETTKEKYRKKQPLQFVLDFIGASKNARVLGIVLRGSSRCHVMCRHKQDNIESGAKSLTLTIYPYESYDVEEALCDPIETLISADRSNETCGMAHANYALIHLSLGGEEVKRGYWPWLAALYHRVQNGSEFVCGGTLISRRVILTANHCLFNEFAQEISPEDLLVYLGRHNRSNNYEGGSVLYAVDYIERFPDYRPKIVSFDGDIGLIVTKKEVRYSEFIRPACIWEGNDPIDALVSQTGVVVGWGNDESNQPSVVPKKVVTKIVSYDVCVESHPVFSGITTKRNFCAGERDGTGPCKGDSGGAFMMKQSEKWAVRGIVSASLRDDLAECDLYQYVVYTDVIKFKSWLISKMPRHSASVTNVYSKVIGNKPTQDITKFSENPLALPQNIDCGLVEPKFEITHLVFRGDYLDRGSWPWLAAVFRNEFGVDFSFYCGGTIISSKAVLTAANCLQNVKSPGEIRVAVGKHSLTDLSDGEFFEVEELVRHPNYTAGISLDADIAVLKVGKIIRFNDLVRPACLWPTSMDATDIEGKIGQIVGWGQTEVSFRSSVPRRVKATVVSNEECKRNDPDALELTNEHSFCAGQLDGSGVCIGDAGSGLLFKENGRWTLRGIVTARINTDVCSAKTYGIYADLAYFRFWIIDNMY